MSGEPPAQQPGDRSRPAAPDLATAPPPAPEPGWLAGAGLPDAAAGPVARRVSDADREQTVGMLHAAGADGRLRADELESRVHGAYEARTEEDLRRLVADLDATASRDVSLRKHPGSATTARPTRLPVRAKDDGGGTRWVVSVMSGSDRSGSWRLASDMRVVSVMGGSDLDLNDAELSAPVTTMTVVSVMGGGNIRVPDGLNVEITEFSLMGGNNVRIGEHRPDPDGPVLRLRMYSLMGGNEVRRGRKLTRAQKRERRRLEQEERRERHRLGH